MILKQTRISRHLSQDTLAEMSGLNVRTVQRIESGRNASLESLKCLASVLEVDVSTLNQEQFVMEKDSGNWQDVPFWLKCWFSINFISSRTTKNVVNRIQVVSHVFGFIFCLLGFVSEAALAGGLLMLANAYLFLLLTWQGDKYGIWYDGLELADVME
jgi:transcriptional regulator with XRE-family HTH domain